ncbi:MAG: PQQ-binding-like beta-propeller repeat protein [Planctomycetota bacterium]
MRVTRTICVVWAAVSGIIASCPEPFLQHAAAATTANPNLAARQMVEAAGVTGGVIVHLGCGDGKTTGELLLNGSYLVHGLDISGENVAKARDYLRSQGLYGPVSVARFDGKSLPYGDNTVNLIVADSMGSVPEAEAIRVLVPRGVLLVGGKRTVKPWPKDIDEWPQYLNKADNNAVAKDSVAGPPRLIQWLDDPLWCRSHMAIPTVASVVTGKGRLFTIEDTALPDNPFLPADFQIVARDAFNGKRLWTRKITRWESETMYIKCQPVQQQRRMAVVDDTLYCTLELEGPLSALDAATGEVLKVYENTSPTQEVAYDDGILFLNVGDRFSSAAYNIVKLKGQPFVEGIDPDGPFFGGGFKDGYAPEIKDKEDPISAIVAVDPESGRQLWAVRDIHNYTAGSLAVQGDYAVYQAANGLFCIHAKTGTRLWANEKEIVNSRGHDSLTPGTTPNTVVIGGDKVFAVESTKSAKILSNPKSTIHAYSLKDGRELWNAPVEGNYQASADICYVGGTLWIGGHNPMQLDVDTGEVLKKIVQEMTGPMGHDRCYRNLITERYFINSKTGGADFLELETGKEFPNHWTRGCCGMGVLPANGLVYSTPYSCTCSMGVMFQGLNAYASPRPSLQKSDDPIRVPRKTRLEKGPAYGKIAESPATSADWPTYRNDGFRSGMTAAEVPAELRVRWEAKLPTQPTALTSAAGKVFGCDKDTHTLYALNGDTGKTEWTFTADGRIDSPPTYHQGMVLFGSRDGWVYCLRAADGAMAWRFKDLPDRLIGAYGQLESKWPVAGSVLIVNNRLYFAAGRCSYLDGGIFLYAIDPRTGELLASREFYGPFAEDTGFPIGGQEGFKNDVLVSDGSKLYLRHKAFDLDLADAEGARHIIPTSNFLDGQPQHRTCWTLASSISNAIWGDIMVSNGREYYEVQGFPIYANHSYFDPRRNGYTLFAGTLDSAGPAAAEKLSRRLGGRGKDGAKKGANKAGNKVGKEVWRLQIPITGKAIAMAGDVLFVAGEPMQFDDITSRTYVAAYTGQLGGRLLAVSAADGKLLAEFPLKAAPVWDSLVLADGRLYISLADGTVQCFGP